MVDFLAMTKADAKAFLQQWLEEGPQRLEWLQRTAASSGGPATFDRTASSLSGLWVWARTRFAWRDSAAPVDEGQLPAWFPSPRGVGFERFSDETIWLIDALARYWAEVLLAEGPPDLRWGTGHSRVPGYIDQNHPVLLGFGDDLPPITIMGSLASQSLTGSAGDGRLDEVHRLWLGMASGAH